MAERFNQPRGIKEAGLRPGLAGLEGEGSVVDFTQQRQGRVWN